MLKEFGLPVRVVVGVAEDDHVAGLARRPFHRTRRFHEERADHIEDDQADDLAGCAGQNSGLLVRYEAEVLDRALDGTPGALAARARGG